MTQALTHVLEQLKFPISETLNVVRCPGGLCNKLYRLSSAEGDFALRCNHPGSAELGVDRELEKRVLEAIAGQPWSPEVLACESQWLLTRWVDGAPPARGDATDLARLAALMRSVHSLRPEWPPLNMALRIQALVDGGPLWPESARHGLDRLLAQYSLPEALCLCHHDWHPGNLLVMGDRWVLLDWEYAAPGDPAMDLAAACQGFELTEVQAAALGEELSISLPRLNEARALMEATALAWYRLLPGQSGASGDSPEAWWRRWEGKF